MRDGGSSIDKKTDDKKIIEMSRDMSRIQDDQPFMGFFIRKGDEGQIGEEIDEDKSAHPFGWIDERSMPFRLLRGGRSLLFEFKKKRSSLDGTSGKQET